MKPLPAAESIFHAARACAPDERQAFVDRACGGDAELHALVVALLRADAEAGDFLSRRSGEQAPCSARHEREGDQIDRYYLVQQLGEGGFGVVWMAEQREPLRRRVALKILKLGMDTRLVTARFEQERQALALMDHPNIAKVLDAGATQTGRPYFVMELVDGVPIVEFCDRENLSIAQRLALFAQVCAAVQHAHGRGIIHRDLKPTNVLVAVQEGRPHAKVIDFGIAKATTPTAADRAPFTEQRQILGTLLYMSPEQAEGSPDIDTRTDVYSLGALLYELLVGEPPFSRTELAGAGWAEVQRILREVEPKKPSTRISEARTGLPSVAAQRQIAPRKLGELVRGDLDWIVMKALEKERSRRYDTVSALSTDILRYLGGEPVSAAPPSVAYRLRKLARRHRVAVTAGGIVALALVLGIAGTSYGLIQALEETHRADQQASKATVAASLAAQAAAAAASAKVEAQENERRAVAEAARANELAAAEASARRRAETIAEFVIAALDSGDPRLSGSQGTTILAAMETAIRDIDAGRFAQEPEIEAHLQSVIALVLQNNGRAERAEPLLEQALGTMEDLYTGDHPEIARMRNDLALVRTALGRVAEAIPLLEEALAMTQRLQPGDDRNVARDLCNLAHAKVQLNRFAEAEAHYTQALAMARRLFPSGDPDVARALNGLAVLMHNLGRLAEAEPLLDEALAIQRRFYPGDHPDIALALDNLGHVAHNLGKAARAEALFGESLEMYRRCFAGDHPQVANGLNNLALARKSLQRFRESEQLLLEALAMLERLYPQGHTATANVLNNLAGARQDLGRAAEAEPLYERALAMAQSLLPHDHEDVAKGLNNLASIRLSLGRAAEAEPLLVEALQIRERVFGANHVHLALAWSNLANARLQLGRAAEAEELYAKAIAKKQEHGAGDHPELPPMLCGLAEARHRLGQKSAAREAYAEALAMAGRLAPSGSAMLARLHWRTGSAMLRDGEAAAALPHLEAAAKIAAELLPAEHRDRKAYEATLAEGRAALGK